METLYDLVEKFVISSFSEEALKNQLTHFKRTVHWVKELNPEADEALLISAIAHDIERSVRKEEVLKKIKEIGLTSSDFLKNHQERGAEIIANFLEEQGAENELIDKVKRLVSKHEVGGDEEQNLLKDADSLSFLENNLSYFLSPEKITATGGIEKVKEKISWMFNRITSDKAKQIAQPWYDKAMKEMGEII